MICLADNDIILKLACCDLVAEAVTALGVTAADVFVLNTAVHKLLSPKKPDKGRVKPGEPEYARLEAFFAAVKVVDAVPAPDEQLAFNDVLGIDTGEAILFSATAAYPGSLLATSDKRSLVALAGAGGDVCRRVCERMAGRVICFEQTLLRVIDAAGFDLVRTRAVPARNCDTALRSVFGSGLEATEDSVRGGLTSYVTDLKRQTGGLLVS